MDIEPKFLSIADVAKFTAESQWTVKAKLRAGLYQARKSGRRTLVDFSSVKQHLATLPEATFSPPRTSKAPSRHTSRR